MSFGKWYEEKKNDDGEASSTSSTWFNVEDTMQLLPTFHPNTISNIDLQGFTFANMKATMEQQMPQKILGLNYQQRFQAFCALLFLSALFFVLAFFVGVPMIAMKPQKFALSFTCGSLLFMGSFALMKGPKEHLMSLFHADRWLFTSIYFVSMLTTIYCTFQFGGLTGYLLVLSSSVAQLVALMWYLISFLPGGTAGLQYIFAVVSHFLKPVIVLCARWQAICIAKCFGWMTGLRTSS